MRLKRSHGGMRRGLFGGALTQMSGSSMEALAASTSSSEERQLSAPAPQVDTARSWLAAAACSGFSFFTWLPVVCSAVLYAGYMDQYPNVARRDASWPFTIMLVVINVGGVLYAMSLEWFSERCLLILAAFLCSGSLVISSFTHDILELVVLLGVVYGMGVASTSIVPTVLIVHHFEKYRATALALVSGSVDVSGMLTPSLVQLFIDKYGFSGCLLLLGGLSLNLFIACIFLKRPPKGKPTDEAAADKQRRTDDGAVVAPEMTKVETSAPKEPVSGRGDHVPGDGTDSAVAPAWQHSRGDVRAWLRSTVSLAMVHVRPAHNSHGGDSAQYADEPAKPTLPDKDGISKQVSSLKLSEKPDETPEGSSSSVESNRFKMDKKRWQHLEEARKIQELADVIEVIPDPDADDEENKAPQQKSGFMHKLREVSTGYIWMVCLSKGAANFCSYTFGLVIVDYAHGSGVLGQKAALLPALFSLGCLTATLLTGPAVDRSWVSKYSAMLLSCIVQAAALLSVSVWSTFPVLALCSFLGGVGRGVRCFLFPVLISDRCSLSDLPAALSIMNAACSVALFLRTPVIGFMRDNSGSYATLLMSLAGVNIVQLVVWLTYTTATKCRSR